MKNMDSEKSITEYLEETPISRFHFTILILGSLIYAFTALNVMLIGSTLPAIIAEWNLDPISTGYFLSAGYAGMFVGALICGIVADYIGRKKTLLMTVSLMTIFTGLCSLAWNSSSMAILRFFAGIGLGGSLPQPGVYVSEFIPSKYRGRFIGLVETAWVYGALMSIIFPFFLIPIYGWRLTFLVALIPIFLIPLIVFYLPESIRYLELKGKQNEAIILLKKHTLLPQLYKEREVKVAKISQEHNTNLREIWSSQYIRRTIMLWIGWAVLVYTYHGIFIWLPTIYAKEFNFTIVKSLYWVFLVTLAQVPGYFSASFLLDKIGRKKVMVIYLAIAGFGSYLLGLILQVEWIFLWSGVISFFNLGAWSALYTYTPELYPTRMRGTGSGFAASIGRVAGIFAPIVTGYIYTIKGLSTTFSVFSFAHFIATIAVVMLGIETKEKTLEEISK